MIKLDVGCGIVPFGNVNVDPLNECFAAGMYFERDPRSIPNFLMADGQFLPFRSKVFDEVYSKGVIEHTSRPQLFFMEMIRTSKDKVKLICPHRFYKDFKFHITYFNRKWFEGILKRLFLKGLISRYKIELTFTGWPHEYLGIIRRPFLIIVEVWKKGFGYFKEF